MDFFNTVASVGSWVWHYLLPFMLNIGVLVFIHEAGHFSLAKFFKIRVDIFSFGFGPRLLGFRRKETDYRISAIPWGGYVKIAGETPEDATGAIDELQSKPVYARFLIFFAGPALNLLLTVILLPIVFMMGIQVPAILDNKPVIGYVEVGSPADNGGLNVGDQIIAINKKPVHTVEEAALSIQLKPKQEITITILRNTQEIVVPIVLEEDTQTNLGYLGIDWIYNDTTVGVLVDGFPAKEAGVLQGDKILKIDGIPVTHWNQMTSIIKSNPSKELEFTIERSGEFITIPITPKSIKTENQVLVQIGIGPRQEMELKKYGFIQAVDKGLEQTWKFGSLIIHTVGKLVFGQLSPKALAGPLVIGKITGDMAKEGFSKLLWWMALFSFNLGILNLLPIPILDGGHILFLLGEVILRKPVNLRFREITTQIGFILIIMLTLYVLFNDVLRIFPNLNKIFPR